MTSKTLKERKEQPRFQAQWLREKVAHAGLRPTLVLPGGHALLPAAKFTYTDNGVKYTVTVVAEEV